MKLSTLLLSQTSVCLLGVSGFTFHHHGFSSSSTPRVSSSRRTTTTLLAKKVGIFFGTSTGATESAAYSIMEALGENGVEPIEIDSLQGQISKTFQEYDSLIVGTPTWNTGADTERSGTGWDEIYYGEMQDLNIQTKKVAVFGLGDSVSYGENYADASGELHDVFEKLGCKLHGYTSQDGYEHEASKAIRGDQFCGLLLDAVNQEELTEERVVNWITQLEGEGFFESGKDDVMPTIDVTVIDTHVSPPSTIDATSVISKLEELESENAKLRLMLEQNSVLLEESILAHTQKNVGEDGFTPHYNPKSGKTMWTSVDGKTCYYTTVEQKTSAPFRP